MKIPENAQTAHAAVFQTESHLGGLSGRLFAVPRLNHPVPKEVADLLDQTISLLCKFDGVIAECERNGTLDTEEGRAELFSFKAEGRKDFSRKMNEGLALVEKARAVLAGRERSLLAVPAIHPNDATGAARDREARERFSQLPQTQRDRLLDEIKANEHRDLMLALARDPIATPYSQQAVGKWVEHARIERADDLEAIAAQGLGLLEVVAGFKSLENVIA